MLIVEDKCRDLKTKISAYQGNPEEIQKLKFKSDSQSNLYEGKLNLIKKVQILEK